MIALRGVDRGGVILSAPRALHIGFDEVIHKARVLRRELEAWGIAPEIFQAVKRPLVLVEDVDDHVRVIRDDPLAEREAVDR